MSSGGSSPLLSEGNNNNNNNSNKLVGDDEVILAAPKWRFAVILPILSTFGVLLYAVGSWPHMWSGEFSLAGGGWWKEWPGLRVVASNEYGSGLYPYEVIAEPHRETRLVAVGGSGKNFEWKIDGEVKAEAGAVARVVFTSVGWHEVAVSTATASTTQRVMCKYVRREVRSLTASDKEAFLSAARELWRTPTAEGRERYGSAYRDVHYFVRAHLYWGANYDCDHWHEGPGFATSHVAMSLAFERSLQSVDPSVSLPYWDFTIDDAASGNWRDGSLGIFGADAFGAASPRNHVVSEGRWASVSAMRNASKTGYSMIVNANDELRPPWVNPAAPTGFRRFERDESSDDDVLSPPSCKHHWWALNQRSWKNLAKNLNGASHGAMHKLVGGAWGTRIPWNVSVAPLFSHADDAWARAIAAYNFFFLKLAYRSGMAVCDSPGEACRCARTHESPYVVLRATGILDAIVDYQADAPSLGVYVVRSGDDGHFEFPRWNDTARDDVLAAIRDRACDWGEPGDMNAAGSPFDVAFWPIHPTIDRIWHAVRLGRRADFDDRWPDEAKCYGHNASHAQPFSPRDLFDDHRRVPAGSGPHGVYTNAELYDLLDPRNDALPYLYDHFDWPHCTASRYCMNATIVDYDAHPWLNCRSWEPEYDGVGRGYVTETRVDAPQHDPPALWDANGDFLTNPRPRPPSRLRV
ncbi:hypothetical protein CTAYLR_003265 [Chrysophaeum taylorii]|uniref:Tyrosinase copper-binding domain-containing protein n=1 Tax=Chrysophaeum taylorii TaxID=2483200 RepID=A0AAD7UB85_9STRA|nr:hypothetical protein CTAYLR_003265 [Chrysophaeum taylorii]